MSGPTLVLLVIAVLAMGLVVLERGPAGPKELALVATLGAAAAAGRVLFAPIPSVKPVTMICVVTGAALGARAGMAVGGIAALASNAFLGQGPWTPPQMLLWGLAGVSGALLRHVVTHRIGLAAVCVVWGYLFGWAINAWFLAAFGPELSWAAFTATATTSLWFDTAHAVGNVVFALVAGPALLRLLSRYAGRIRMEIVWEDAPPQRAGPVTPEAAGPA